MYPIIFESGGFTFYSYGFLISLGILAGVTYMTIEGKRAVGLSFDQANALFLCIFFAAFVGGKLFLFFEDPSGFAARPADLFTGSGFVFYGSFLLSVPTMLWFFRRHNLPTYKMLDVMAITTCLVHMFGRIGCFLAGCCYGKPTDAKWGLTFTDASCHASPLNTPLIPTQLLEAFYILLVMIFLLFLKGRRKFNGQLFLTYLILYAIGRFVMEYFRGDVVRGFLINDVVSHSQFIALCVFIVAIIVYTQWSKKVITP